MRAPIIVALDYGSLEHIYQLVDSLDPARCKLKVGKGLFTRFGPDLVRRLVDRQFDVFLDLKFHDIPTTVATACQAAADLGIWMLNVHALGGRKMLAAAQRSLEQFGADKPLLIAVTLLTSLDTTQLSELGMSGTVTDRVLQLAQLTQDVGLDGVVCSAQEVSQLRQVCGQDFCLVTPGIRLDDNAADDQQRVMSPRQAIAAGSNYLVIGRPITQATHPLQVLQQIELAICDGA